MIILLLYSYFSSKFLVPFFNVGENRGGLFQNHLFFLITSLMTILKDPPPTPHLAIYYCIVSNV